MKQILDDASIARDKELWEQDKKLLEQNKQLLEQSQMELEKAKTELHGQALETARKLLTMGMDVDNVVKAT